MQSHTSDESSSHPEAGYTLVALLAVMTVLAISLTAAAPVLKQQAQRARELEAIRRGEEVAEAIRLYRKATNRLPTSMKDLIEGAQVPGRTKKVQVLRASAARDPLSEDGEWKLVRQSATSSELCDFVGAVTRYNGGTPPAPTTGYEQLVGQCASQIASAASGLGTVGSSGSSDSGTGEFIGVASKSTQQAVVTYFGIERHNQWVFTFVVPKME